MFEKYASEDFLAKALILREQPRFLLLPPCGREADSRLGRQEGALPVDVCAEGAERPV